MLFIVLLDFLGIVKYCLLGYSFDKTSWLFNQNGWFILLLARACYPAKHVHLSTQDSETTKPLKRHSSRRMLVINHLPSEFQGIKDLPNKPKKHHTSPHVLPANHAPFPLKNYGPPMASSPDHEDSKTPFSGTTSRATQFSVAPDQKHTPGTLKKPCS